MYLLRGCYVENWPQTIFLSTSPIDPIVNFKYRDGIIPSHTKLTFEEMNVLTVQNVIVKNALIFMQKIRNVPT